MSDNFRQTRSGSRAGTHGLSEGFPDRQGGQTSAGRRTAIPTPIQKAVDFLTLHPRSYDPDWAPKKEDPALYPYRQHKNPLDRLKHYVTDDLPSLPGDDKAQWSSEWLKEKGDEAPEDDVDFADWIFRGTPDTEWHNIPYPGAPWTPQKRQEDIDFRRQHPHPSNDLWLSHKIAGSLAGEDVNDLRHFLTHGPREFITAENTDDREELLYRAHRLAADKTSTWPQEPSRQVVAAFCAEVDKLISSRPRRLAARPVTQYADFPDQLMFG